MDQNTGQINQNKPNHSHQLCGRCLSKQIMQQIYTKSNKQNGIILNLVTLIVLGMPPDWWNQTNERYSQLKLKTQKNKHDLRMENYPVADELTPQTNKFVNNRIVFQATKAG